MSNAATRRFLLLGIASACVLGGLLAVNGTAPVAASAVTTAAPDWGTTIGISPVGESAAEPRLAMSADGQTVTSVWRQGGVLTNIRYAVSADAGTTWSTAADMTAVGRSAAQPQVAMSDDGRVQSAVWWRSDGSKNVIQVGTSSDSGATWTSDDTLSAAGQDAGDPAVAISSNGSRQVVAWRRGVYGYQRVQVSSSSDGGGTWSGAVDLSAVGNAYPPAVATSADGMRQTVVWSYESGRDYIAQVSTSSDGGATWSSAVDMSETTGSALGPTVEMSADGMQQMVSWVRNSNVVQSRSSSDGGATWGAAVNVSVDVGYHYYPALAMSPDGRHRTVSWYLDASPGYVQSRSSSDGGATWGALVRLSGPGTGTGSDRPSVAMSDDGQDQTVAWSFEYSGSGSELVQSASSSDGGLQWDAAVDVTLPGAGAFEPTVLMSANGLIQALTWYRWTGSHNQVQFVAAITAPPAPPAPPAPVYPPSAPLDVAGAGGDGSASVTWAVPASTGSFAVSTYQVTASPSGRSCLVTSQSCEITGLSNGRAYTFTVRALNGAGWSPWSAASAPVTPSAPVVESIVITGARVGKPGVIITGASTLEMGAIVVPWLRFPGQPSFTESSARILVDEAGGFTWERRTGRKVTIYVATLDGTVVSNRVVIR